MRPRALLLIVAGSRVRVRLYIARIFLHWEPVLIQNNQKNKIYCHTSAAAEFNVKAAYRTRSGARVHGATSNRCTNRRNCIACKLSFRNFRIRAAPDNPRDQFDARIKQGKTRYLLLYNVELIIIGVESRHMYLCARIWPTTSKLSPGFARRGALGCCKRRGLALASLKYQLLYIAASIDKCARLTRTAPRDKNLLAPKSQSRHCNCLARAPAALQHANASQPTAALYSTFCTLYSGRYTCSYIYVQRAYRDRRVTRRGAPVRLAWAVACDTGNCHVTPRDFVDLGALAPGAYGHLVRAHFIFCPEIRAILKMVGGKESPRRPKLTGFVSTMTSLMANQHAVALYGKSIKVVLLVLGRLLSGMGVGGLYVLIALYLSEIASTKARDVLLFYQQAALSLGVAASYCFAHLIYQHQSTDLTFYTIYCALTCLPALGLSCFLPPSPYSLREPKSILMKLHGRKDEEYLNVECQRIERDVEKIMLPMAKCTALREWSYWRTVMLTLILEICRQLSGIQLLTANFISFAEFSSIASPYERRFTATEMSLHSCLAQAALALLATAVPLQSARGGRPLLHGSMTRGADEERARVGTIYNVCTFN
ncbi:unnamed protein product [Trichogramma brassicae]|uniref:Major facilitator superfamily (MFS) profile domain-containing protein n=1 Tax=Trichogramma brassicae TaxID=86971 RepID=A0A6H5I9L8_9HYME|nr:unnamed protein product [Trichogramma brassicae]